LIDAIKDTIDFSTSAFDTEAGATISYAAEELPVLIAAPAVFTVGYEITALYLPATIPDEVPTVNVYSSELAELGVAAAA
jgi:hypothetical protein